MPCRRPVPASAAGQRFGSIEEADVVEPEESAGEDVLALDVLSIHPPCEVQQQLLKRALEEIRSRCPRLPVIL